jgi:predicted ATPase/transcriptional regulator with XRE-family HTH domain/Tfp pilus assembly protein PilF
MSKPDNSENNFYGSASTYNSSAPASIGKTLLLPGQLLQKYRQRSGLSQEQLATFLDLRSRRMIQNWESNDNLPRAERLQKLIELYLSRGVFTQDKQQQEVRLLWDTVKNYSDTKSRKLSIYPVFDSDWFDAIFNQWLATQTSPQDPAMDDARAEAEADAKVKVKRKAKLKRKGTEAEAGKPTGYALLPPPSGSAPVPVKNVTRDTNTLGGNSSSSSSSSKNLAIVQTEVKVIGTPVPTRSVSRPPDPNPKDALSLTTIAALAGAETTATVIGRQQETSDIMRLLQPMASHPRLVTLTGMGGVGKTTLALQIAQQFLQSNSFEDGVVWLPLGAVRYPEQLVEALALSLNLTTVLQDDNEQKSLFKAICSYLSDKRMLLVLDNFEQILEARTLISELFKSTSTSPSSAVGGIKVLITSRCVLDLPIEQQYPLLPLATPPLNFDAFDPHHNHNQGQSKLLEVDDKSLDSIAQSPAVELFVRRIKQVKLDFELTRENALQIARICERLDGLPLAIEIAASRIKLFSLSALLQRLAEPLSFLGSKAVNAEAHQRTLYATLNWSYNLLEDTEQQMFRWFGLLVGGGSLHTLEWLANRLDLDQNGLELVYALINKSLLTKIDFAGKFKDITDNPTNNKKVRSLSSSSRGLATKTKTETVVKLEAESDKNLLVQLCEPRFRMLEIVREFALEQLQFASEEFEQLTLLLMEYYAEIFIVGEAGLRSSEQVEWLKWFALEYPNIQMLLESLPLTVTTQQQNSSLHSQVLRAKLKLLPYLRHFWLRRGYVNEGSEYLDKLLIDTKEQLSQIQVDTNNQTHTNSITRATLPDNDNPADNDDNQINFDYARALEAAALLLMKKNKYDKALNHLSECASIYTKMGNKTRLANTVNMKGIIKKKQGNFSDAKQLYEEALGVYSELKDAAGALRIFTNLGNVERLLGNYTTAIEYYQKVLVVAKQTQDLVGIVTLLNSLGLVLVEQGDYELGEKYLREALLVQSQTMEKSDYSQIINNLGLVAFYQNNYEEALLYYNESLEIDRELDIRDGIAHSLHNLAQLHIIQGRLEEARQYLEESFSLIQEGLDSKNILVECLYYRNILTLKELHVYYNSRSSLLQTNDRARSEARKKKEQVLKSLHQVVQLQLEIGNKKDLAFGLSALGRYAMLDENWRKAVVLFSFATKTLAQLERKNDNSDWTQEYGTDLTQLKQYRLSELEFEAAWQEGSSISLELLLESEGVSSNFSSHKTVTFPLLSDER